MNALNTKALERKVERIENYIPNAERINLKVSKVNVAWQLDHSLKVIIAVVKNMEASDPALYENNFSFLGKIFLSIGFFPRGKARSPKYVKPPEVILNSDLVSQVKEARQKIKDLQNLDRNAFFKHPIFRNINTIRVVRFLDTHTNHHLKIVKSILK